MKWKCVDASLIIYKLDSSIQHFPSLSSMHVSHENVSIWPSLFCQAVRFSSVMFLHAVSVIIILICASSPTQPSFQLGFISSESNIIQELSKTRSSFHWCYPHSIWPPYDYLLPQLEIKSWCSTRPDFQIVTLGWSREEHVSLLTCTTCEGKHNLRRWQRGYYHLKTNGLVLRCL